MPWEAAANGVIGLETAFPAVYTMLVEPGLLNLSTLVERMTAGPAAAFGLEAPVIRVGAPANLGLWDLRREFVVEPPYESRSVNCAFAGRRLRGRLRGDSRPRQYGLPQHGRGGGLMSAHLMLEDGTVYTGLPYGAEGIAVGELVFTTSMTGYQEVVTDPSFAGQLVTFTQPMIGNYGVEEDVVGVDPAACSRGDRAGGPKRDPQRPPRVLRLAGRTTGWWGCRASTPARSPAACATVEPCGQRS